VFSTGSIAFSQSLPYNNSDNNVSKLLENVASAFSKEGCGRLAEPGRQ
jgi:N,N-dimethylformamidase